MRTKSSYLYFENEEAEEEFFEYWNNYYSAPWDGNQDLWDMLGALTFFILPVFGFCFLFMWLLWE